jgi:hypothetical protein
LWRNPGRLEYNDSNFLYLKQGRLMAQYQLERLAPVVASDLEQLGTKEKFWFSYMDTEPRLWLFKFSRVGTGEHWSEKCAAELCHLLGIPHAEYELALTDGRYGVMILPT